MKKIVLLRHGESAWNKENRFTGWTDVDLTEKGVAEALKAGELLAEKGFRFPLVLLTCLLAQPPRKKCDQQAAQCKFPHIDAPLHYCSFGLVFMSLYSSVFLGKLSRKGRMVSP